MFGDYNRCDLKLTCYWWLNKGKHRTGCGVLNTLQCEQNGTCSFYETEEQHRARIEKLKSTKQKPSK